VVDIREFRVEFNLSGQGHYVIAKNCVDAINAVDTGQPWRRDSTFVHCEIWKEDYKRVGKPSVFGEVKKPDWWKY